MHDYLNVHCEKMGNFIEKAQLSIDAGHRIGVKLHIVLWIALEILQGYATACRYREIPYHSHTSIQCIAMVCK